MSARPIHPRSATAFRLEPELHERLRAAANERNVTLNWLVNKLLDESLDRLIPADDLRLTSEVPIDWQEIRTSISEAAS